MADTGAPLFLPQPVRGEGNWDDDVNGAFDTVNMHADAVLDSLALKADLVDNKIPSAQLPTLSAISAIPVVDESAMIGLSTATVGTAVFRIDLGEIYVLTSLPYSMLGNWTLVGAGSGVSSYNGQTGALTGKPEYSTPGTWALKQTFTVSPSVPTASANDAPVPFAQMTSAISTATTSGPAGRYTATIGNGSLTSFPLTHGRETQIVQVTVIDAVTNKKVEPDEVTFTSSSVVTISFEDPPGNNALKVCVI